MREKIATWPSARASRLSVKATETLAGARVLTVAEIEQYNAFAFDPGGSARNLDLPAEEVCQGVYLFVANKADAAEAITVRNDATGTVTVVGQSESCLLWCDGAAWHALTGAVNS